jgi:hypothetical protein
MRQVVGWILVGMLVAVLGMLPIEFLHGAPPQQTEADSAGDKAASPSAAAKPAGDSAVVEKPADAREYRLAYKFAPNQFVHYEVVHDSTITVQYAEASETTFNRSKTRRHYRVMTVDEHGAGQLQLEIDHVEMQVRFGDNEPIVFDSDSAEPPPRQFEHVKKTVGQPLARFKVAANGRLLDVVRLNATAQPEDKSGDVPDNDPSRNFLVVFPEKPLRLGETWKDPIVTKVNVAKNLDRPITLHRLYRLESVDGNLATISLSTAVLEPIQNPGVRAQLIQRLPSGTIVFDLEQGIILSRKLSIDKLEVGVFGEKSSMRAVSERTERVLPPAELARKQGKDSDDSETK